MENNNEAQRQIIDLLIKNEAAMRELYEVYAKKFQVYRKFWDDIAKEEESHAAWINTLYNKMKAGLVNFSEQRFPIDAIKETITHLKSEKEKAENEDISLTYALETAVHVENGMLENKFFEVFDEDDSMELQIILSALKLGTEQHFERIKKVWEKERK